MVANPVLEDHMDEVVTLLARKGYTLEKELGNGEGHTANVFSAEYHSGSLTQKRVVKIPRLEIDPTSVTTLINLSKGDLDERAVLAQCKISHPNIIQIYDAFRLGERTMTAEENFDAISLRSLVRMGGPIVDPERFKEIVSQIFNGLHHLHYEERLLHRDVKPSNILINQHNNHVKICDLQNVGPLFNSGEEQLLPTRGGTAYAEPRLLNALISGQPTQYNLTSELYALGATLYYMLTGEELNHVSLKPGAPGRKIQVGDSELEVILEKDGASVTEINLDAHQKEISKKIKNTPSCYHNLLRYCLSNSVQDLSPLSPLVVGATLNNLLEEATSPKISYSLKKLAPYAKWFVGISAVITGILAGASIMDMDRERKMRLEPTVLELLSSSIFRDGDLIQFLKDESLPTQEYLAPAFKYLVDNRKNIDKMTDNYKDSIENAAGLHGIGRKLIQSVMLSSLLLSDEEASQEYPLRDEDTLVPYNFVMSIVAGRGWASPHFNVHNLTELQKVGYAGAYLKFCIGTNGSVADVFSGYFTDNLEDVFKARISADNYSYFPTSERFPFSEANPLTGEVSSGIEERIIPGYSEKLSPIKRRLIDQAIALYYITDNAGKIHWETLDDKYRPTKGLDAK